MVFFLIWVLCGLWAMHIARTRGHNAILWFILGFIFGPFGVLFAALQPKPKPDIIACPFCAEPINGKAVICKHCGKDIVQAPPAPPPPPGFEPYIKDRQTVHFVDPDDIPPWERKTKLQELWDTLNARGSSIDTADGLQRRAPAKYVVLVAVVLVAWFWYLLSQPADPDEVRRLSQTSHAQERQTGGGLSQCVIASTSLAAFSSENYDKIVSMANSDDTQAIARMIAGGYATVLEPGIKVQRLGGFIVARIRPIGTTVELYTATENVDCSR